MAANVERIREVVAMIERWENQPGIDGIEFNMGTWYAERVAPSVVPDNWCGTSVCFAGAAAVHGKQKIWHFNGDGGNSATLIMADDTKRSISDWAADYLGLTYEQADGIFLATRVSTSAELKAVINYWVGNVFDGVEPDSFEEDYDDDYDCECELCVPAA